jgi:DNA-binding beta-propeller fold protein YncE
MYLKMNSKNIIKLETLFAAIAIIYMSFLLFVSCGDADNNGKGVDYDPSKPVVLTSFHPDSGGMASKVIFDGENFGSDPSKIKVYFNQKPAPVIGSSGQRMYAVVPRLPGDTCIISVVVGSDSAVYDQQFRYKIGVSVSTIAGNGGGKNQGSMDEAMVEGALDQAVLWPQGLCIDNDGNLFALIRNNNGGLVKINEEENTITFLARAEQGIVWPPTPCVDLETGIVVFPSDHVGSIFWTFDPKEGWAYRERYMLFKENPKNIDSPSQAWKKTTASCRYDGHYYTHFHNGQVTKIHPKTYEAEFVYKIPNSGDCRGMAFHPKYPKIAYMAFYDNVGEYSHSICTMDITDPENTFKKVSGGGSGGGFRDGEVSVALFNRPCQIFFDPDGNLYIADEGNHCIRRLNTETNMVETVVGVPGEADWKDGLKDEARFNEPYGIAVGSDGTVYVGDAGNARIRKLAIE